MTNRVYDSLKWVALTVIPAVVVFLGVVAPVWDMPHTEEVITTVAAVGVLLGAIVGVKAETHKARNAQTVAKGDTGPMGLTGEPGMDGEPFMVEAYQGKHYDNVEGE